ncbi:MAG: clostripain-related cysteine peptidase [Oscillospiraceae bacterium]|nr:clostripain-related cysteine peptidase [Oscillospiraceae bacterium]
MKRSCCLCLVFVILSSCAAVTFPPDRPPRPVVVVSEEPARPGTFTLFWYVNGSDLESGGANDAGGAFTENLREMLSRLPPDDRFQVVLFTGGTRDWKTEGFSEAFNQVHLINHQGLTHGSVLSEGSIAQPETLASFLQVGFEKAPADRYGLIFWDHGSGVPIGFGYDELREPRYMDMIALAEGLEQGLGGKRLAFIGFDACLMATVEVAAACAPYADVLIASEELEPFGGWDYAPLMQSLGDNPETDAKEIGRVIVNGYFAARKNAGETLTLSVTDLRKIEPVIEAVGAMAEEISRLMDEEGFLRVSRIRSRVKYYGGANQSVDMIDLAHLASRLKGDAPEKAERLTRAVKDCVLINRHTAASPNSNGLSIYFPYENEGVFKHHLDVYLQSEFSQPYLEFVRDFTTLLTQGDASLYMVGLTPRKSGKGYAADIPEEWRIFEARGVLARRHGYGVYLLVGMDTEAGYDEEAGQATGTPPSGWLTVNGNPAFAVCEDGAEDIKVYSILAELDGRKVDLAVSCRNGDFTFLGAIPEAKDGRIPLPIYLPIDPGDAVTLLYPKIDTRRPGHEEEFARGPSFTVEEPLKFEFAPVDGIYGFMLVDCYNNEYVTDLRQAS